MSVDGQPTLLLAHEALVLMLAEATTEIEQLRVALVSRTTIGQAQGILMERLHIDGDVAFEYLQRASSHSNRKLLDIARDIVQSRELPDGLAGDRTRHD